MIRCRVMECSKQDKKRTPADWMEWQTNALAPRILMPHKKAVVKAREFIAKQRMFFALSVVRTFKVMVVWNRKETSLMRKSNSSSHPPLRYLLFVIMSKIERHLLKPNWSCWAKRLR